MTETLIKPASAEPARFARAPGGTVMLFAATAFLGAALLFVVQPMATKLVLPSFGGSATVWSTSSLFFQILLLLGYVYTHGTTRKFGVRWQLPVHFGLLVVPLALLPMSLPGEPLMDTGTSPILRLLHVLAVMVGLPFLVIATSGPLLQRWYSWSGTYRAEDPYFLFAASNIGSFVGLLAYPFVIEPLLTLEEQRLCWSGGFVLFAILTATCGVVTRKSASRRPMRAECPAQLPVRPLGWRRMVRWAFLAFLPSAMMLAVTAHISTDVAPIPLLWVVPLAVYLATFIAAFGRSTRAVPRAALRLAVGSTLLAAAAAIMQAETSILLDVVINMLMLGSVAFVAHGRLAEDRPEVNHLTTFYLVLAGGGALGGVLNGVLAPLIFDRVLEYPLVVVLAPLALITSSQGRSSRSNRQGKKRPIIRISVVGLSIAFAAGFGATLSQRADYAALASGGLILAFAAGCLLSSQRLLVAVLIVGIFSALTWQTDEGTLAFRRTFFGSYRVVQDQGRRALAHGTTLHGMQWLDARRGEPTTYYARSGPFGDAFNLRDVRDVGVIGLGVGTIAAYGKAGQHFTFFEIDPEVVSIARDKAFFTYLRDSQAEVSTVIGDGRLQVARLPKHSLDMLVLDAFSSDAIPEHLLTTQAMRLYEARLRPGGLLVVHISNKVFDLAPVLSGDAEALGWAGRVGLGGEGPGASLSRWVVLARDPSQLSPLNSAAGWGPLPKRSVTWTDDYSSVLSVLR